MIIPRLLQDSPYRSDPEIDRIARRLLPEPMPNHAPSHSSLGPIFAKELRDSATAYMIGPSTTDAISRILSSKRRRQLVYAHCRAPCGCAYFEFDDSGKDFSGRGMTVRSGLVTEGDRDFVKISYFVINIIDSSEVLPFMQISLSFDDMKFYNVIEWAGHEVSKLSATHAFMQCAGFWTVLRLRNGVEITETITREGRKAKSRGRFCLCALNSYNKVSIDQREATSKHNHVVFREGGPGRRYHGVDAHDRFFWRGPELFWTWVRAHHRGNAALGVIRKERLLN